MEKQANEPRLPINRFFTQEGEDPLDEVKWTIKDVTIPNQDGSVQFGMDEIEAPVSWSDQAVTIAASKYFKGADDINDGAGESSIRDLIKRVVNTLKGETVKQEYLPLKKACAFRDELAHMILHQMASFNSPVWFNCGLHEEYGITGSDSLNFFWDADSNAPAPASDTFTHPQLSACFIQSIEDDLNDIWDHAGREGRIFRGGSGTGSNFSTLRAKGEGLSTGGTSSGVLSFLEVFDRVAGSTKSGGTNRRAAKMVILNTDHPEIEDFINWKMHEEEKARVLIDAGYDPGMDGEAYRTVSGQNSNNSIRATDEFMQAVVDDDYWDLKEVVSGEVAETVKAADLFEQACEAAWNCGDPGIQFDTTMNEWHTCPRSDRINATNPCSEFVFVDDSACNLASLNLVAFLDDDGNFDVDAFRHACRILIIAQDAMIDYASYPTAEICQNSHKYRPLGLGYANLGSLLMRMGLPYDSKEGRVVAAAITAIMTATAYEVSAELANVMGPFDAWLKNREAMSGVIDHHRSEVDSIIDAEVCPEYLLDAAKSAWNSAQTSGKDGYRNAQVSLLAPTGTISFIMDADTTGVEPAYALVAYKTYAGGGYSKLVNGAIIPSLRQLSYDEQQIEDIRKYILGYGVLPKNGGESGVTASRLQEKGFTDDVIEKINAAIPNCPNVDAAILSVPEANVLVDSFVERMRHNDISNEGSPLRLLGFTDDEIHDVNEHCCGHSSMEGAPHIKNEHLAVFDCASSTSGNTGRTIAPLGHVNMMAAIQPFLSGGVSKTVNLPNDATTEDVADIYMDAWNKGLKCIAIYRDGCKGGQPLSAGNQQGDNDDEEEERKQQEMQDVTPIKPLRQEPPMLIKNAGSRRKIELDRYTMYVHVYRDPETDRIIEIFVNVNPGGGALAGMMDFSMRLVSMLLQYGVPIEDMIRKFAYLQFEPAGMTTHPEIQTCRSIIDLIFRTVAVDVLGDASYSSRLSIPSNNTGDDEMDEVIDDAIDTIDKQAIESMPSETVQVDVQIANEDDACPKCGSHNLQRTGTCKVCRQCGTSLGCS